jgi:hypothetical protein
VETCGCGAVAGIPACYECMTYFVTYYGFHLINTAYLVGSINTRSAYCATLVPWHQEQTGHRQFRAHAENRTGDR